MDDGLLSRYRRIFSLHEGTLRNINVLETDGQDWRLFLPFLHASPYAVEFLIDGEKRLLPERVEDLFALSTDTFPVICLHVHRELLKVNCYCFAAEGMEFDISARDFQDETILGEQVARLVDFIRTIGHVLNKVIILAPESSPDVPLFRFDPGTKEEIWFLENIETLE